MLIQPLAHEQALYLLRLRTVIARAAQKDSLQWWEDESLTSQGGYILERVFPGAPALTGRNLALHTATLRHRVALQGFDDAIHLFRISLDNIDKLAMRSMRNHFEDGVTNLPAPIPDLDTLQEHLLAIIGTPPRYKRSEVLTQNKGLRIWLPQESTDIVERASALAWAYLDGEIGKPVFPYIVEQR